MIRDLSLTLQAILDDTALASDFPELFAAQVAFDRPTESFNPSVPTINLFLFNVRENMELRSNEPQVTLSGGLFSTKRAPIRVACSYLLTAWPAGGGDLPLQEHRLLSQALQVLSRYPLIPNSFLRGKLIGQDPFPPMLTAQSEGSSEPHEFWAAIGNKMRASVMVTATISMEVFPTAVVAPEVIASSIRLDRRASPDSQELVPDAGPARFRIGGRVADGASVPVADASVQITELGLSARTDGDGRYQIGAMAAGTYTLRVEKGVVVAQTTVVVPPGATTAYDVLL
jgi:hypothetical protein